MTIFDFPAGLDLIAHFSLPKVQTWGTTRDQEYKASVREAAGLEPGRGVGYSWFVFAIRCTVAQSRGKRKRQNPDVENIPKLIVDAFTGILYPDDDLHYVRGVQVEAGFGDDSQECTDVWIFGKRVA
jgi:Holliday junction resolvase RusA-like endonuclease